MRARRRIIHPSASLLFVAVLGGGCLRANPPPPWVAGHEATEWSAEPTVASVPSTPEGGVLPADPGAAFTALQQRLLAASSIEVAVEIESSAPYPSLLTGTLALRAGNHVELAVDGQFKGETVNLRLRSQDSGHLVGGPHGDGDATIDVPIPAKLNESVVVGMLGMGLLHNLALLVFGMPPDHAAGGAAEWVATSGHTWDTGRDATVNGAPARALTFQIAVEGQAVGDATLWLDAVTGLPQKREVNVHFKGEGEGEAASGTMHVTESYLKFQVTP
jgi:hypothetical protein